MALLYLIYSISKSVLAVAHILNSLIYPKYLFNPLKLEPMDVFILPAY